MQRNHIKEILRENIQKHQILKEVRRKLYEAEENGDIKEQLRSEYPHLMELKKTIGKQEIHNYLNKQSKKLHKSGDVNLMDPTSRENDAKRIDYAIRKDGIIPTAIENEEWPSEVEEGELKVAETTAKWYESKNAFDEAREETKSKLEEMFPEAFFLYEKKSVMQNPNKELYNPYLKDKSIGDGHSPFLLRKITDIVKQGVFQGIRNLSPGMIDKLKLAEEQLPIVYSGGTPDGYEHRGKGSNRKVGDHFPNNINERIRMEIANFPDNVSNQLNKVINQYQKNAFPNGMPEMHKKSFWKFHRRLEHEARNELDIQLFINADEETRERLKKVLIEYWKYKKGDSPDFDNVKKPEEEPEDDSKEGPDSQSQPYSDDEDPNYDDPDYDPEDHR